MPLLRSISEPLLLCWILALPILWFSLVWAPYPRVDVGVWGDHATLSGAHGREEDQISGETFRWTMAAAEIRLPHPAPADRLLQLRLHGRRPSGPPPIVDLQVAGRQWGQLPLSPTLRVYRVLLPEAPLGLTHLRLTSDTIQPEGDPRSLGFAIDWYELQPIGMAWQPTWFAWGGQVALYGLALLMLARLVVQPRIRLFAAAAALLALLLLNMGDPLWSGLGLPFWLIGMVMSLLALGIIDRQQRWVLRFEPLTEVRFLMPWLSAGQARLTIILLLFGLLLRLFAAAHPLFDAHDLPVHDRWMRIVAAGQLYLYSTPGELQNRLTFNPPAGYILLQPLWLLIGDLRLTLQIGVALIDWFGCLLLIPLAREFGLPRRAMLIALALAAALPISMTMLWFGFATNNIAQTLWLLLLWRILVLVRPRSSPHVWREALLVGVIAAACAMTHVGALVLLAVMLAILVVGGVLVIPRDRWMLLAGALAAAAGLTLLIYVSAAAVPVIQQPPPPRARTLAESLARGWEMRDIRLLLVGRAWTLGFTELLLALLPAGLLLLWQQPQRHAMQRLFLAGLVAICLVFFGVYMSLGFLTRYIYFAAPIICLAGGAALSALWRRPGGRWLVLAVVALVIATGLVLWFGAAIVRDEPSLVPLTH